MEWAQKIEGDSDLIALYASDGAMMTFSALADEYEKWWSARHNSKGLNSRLGFWRDLYDDTRIIEVDAASIRVALKVYRQTHAPSTTNSARFDAAESV